MWCNMSGCLWLKCRPTPGRRCKVAVSGSGRVGGECRISSYDTGGCLPLVTNTNQPPTLYHYIIPLYQHYIIPHHTITIRYHLHTSMNNISLYHSNSTILYSCTNTTILYPHHVICYMLLSTTPISYLYSLLCMADSSKPVQSARKSSAELTESAFSSVTLQC